jgi:ketosteroid isomerase-like protein
MTNTEIAKSFSNGEFERVYEHFAENAEWVVVGENKFCGKQAIIANCEKVASYFKTVTTDFKTVDVITEDRKVAVSGTASFKRDDGQTSTTSACDLYEFDDAGDVIKISSYCIQL